MSTDYVLAFVLRCKDAAVIDVSVTVD